jgi:hypothetical protein
MWEQSVRYRLAQSGHVVISVGKCPAAPAAPLPGKFEQNILAENPLASCRKVLSSYTLECHIIYLFTNLKHFSGRDH